MSEERVVRKLTVSGRLISNPHKLNDDGKYKAMIVFDGEFVNQKKIDKYVETIEALAEDAKKEVFGKKAVKVTEWALRYGDDPEFENTYEKHYISATSAKPFKMVKRVNESVVTLDEEEAGEYIYAGAIVAMPVNVYAMAKKGDIPNHVNVSSRGSICFIENAPALSAGTADDSEYDDFNSVEEEYEEEDGSFN